MKLVSVFWDYPQFLDESYLNSIIQSKKNSDIYWWIMTRFLEHGRAIDALHFFTINEISQNLDKLRLSDYALKKWKRLIEVYSDSQRK